MNLFNIIIVITFITILIFKTTFEIDNYFDIEKMATSWADEPFSNTDDDDNSYEKVRHTKSKNTMFDESEEKPHNASRNSSYNSKTNDQSSNNYTNYIKKSYPKEQSNNSNISQKDLSEILISKLRNRPNVEIKTEESMGKHSSYYKINVKHNNLEYYGNIFHSGNWNTVSHTARVINISLIFKDNEKHNEDMYTNSDDIIKIFQEIAGTTINNIIIDYIPDKRGNKHLSLKASTIVGASLVFTHSKTIEFVKSINQKYGIIPDYVTKKIKPDENISDGAANVAEAANVDISYIKSRRAELEKQLNEIKQQLVELDKLEKDQSQLVVETQNSVASTDSTDFTASTADASITNTIPQKKVMKLKLKSVTVGSKVLYKETKNKEK